MTTPSFDIIIRSEEPNHIYTAVDIYTNPFEIRNKQNGARIATDMNVDSVEELLHKVADPYVWDHYMFYSEKPAWVDGFKGKFSAVKQDKPDLYITQCDGIEELVSLPPSAIHGGTFYIYIHTPTAKSLPIIAKSMSEAIRVVKKGAFLDDEDEDEDEDDPAQTPFAASYYAASA